MAKHSRFDQAGYLSVDDRASGGRHREDDVLGCGHCQASVPKRVWKAHGGMCWQCDSELCLTCAERAVEHGCENFRRLVERRWSEIQRRSSPSG
jgi:hypothetical protein